jgi:hypothetical protein
LEKAADYQGGPYSSQTVECECQRDYYQVVRDKVNVHRLFLLLKSFYYSQKDPLNVVKKLQ